MIIKTKNNQPVLLRNLATGDFEKLYFYLSHLGSDTVKRYAPHNFDKESVIEIYKHSDEYAGYIAVEIETSEIIAYSIIKTGYLENDGIRLQSYGLTPDDKTDCTFAPSVADLWQSKGIGNSLFLYMLADLKAKGIKRIILWGGVQSDNQKAINFYLKNGFQIIGHFEHNGFNNDMILEIP